MNEQLYELIRYCREQEAGCTARLGYVNSAYDERGKGEMIGQIWAYQDVADQLVRIINA